jgi:hypothetical protein
MSEMWGESKITVNDVHIRICDDFGQLLHPSPRKVEPDPVHRTAGAAGQDELPFQIGNTERPFCTVAWTGLSFSKVTEPHSEQEKRIKALEQRTSEQ